MAYLLEFLTVHNYHNRKGKILNSQGKKQNEDSLSGSNSTNFHIQKALFGKKNNCALLCALLKNRKCICL
jgi:hypothetical protein